MPEKILCVDDDEPTNRLVGLMLSRQGFQITLANNGSQALQLASSLLPDLILLDIMMPDMDGYEVVRRLRVNPKTSKIPIIMFTSKSQMDDKIAAFEVGADDYLTKPSMPRELIAHVKAVLSRTKTPPYPVQQEYYTFNINCEPEQRLRISIHGEGNFRITTKDLLKLDESTYARHSELIQNSEDWRFYSRETGKNLFRILFKEHDRIMSSYYQTKGKIEREKLFISLESDSSFLKVPMECLFDDTTSNGNFIILQHPFTRFIHGVYSPHLPLCGDILNILWEKKEPLRVLVVEADTLPPLPGVAQEIEAVKRELFDGFAEKGIICQITHLHGKSANGENFCTTLREQKFQMVHFSGHAHFDPTSPEQSYLALWGQEEKGSIQKITVPELSVLLSDSQVRFFYLSCCNSSTSTNRTALLDDDFLGIMDGVISAGVPAVLGFRWPVSDDGAKNLAIFFYKALIEYGELPIAIFRARQELAAQNRDDPAWLSPIMVIQK